MCAKREKKIILGDKKLSCLCLLTVEQAKAAELKDQVPKRYRSLITSWLNSGFCHASSN